MNLFKVLALLLFILFVPSSPAKDIIKKEPVIRYERCDNMLFYATTLDNKKEIKICLFDQMVTYAFGDIDSLIRDRYISFKIDNIYLNPSPDINNFAISYEGSIYEILYYYDNKSSTKGYLNIINYKDNKKDINTIKLNPNSINSRIYILNHK